MTLFNRTRQREVASRVVRADTALSRMRGLLGRDGMEPGEALWIVPCAMIHTLFMRFSIDAVFVDRELRVLRVMENLSPWRFSPWVFGAHGVLELAGGALRGAIASGDQLEIR
ncbi:MAG: DUF192 domain-containing protein [Elusimicrobia bacterium]|nr:DUF192 domain-containing protein [Elusimicrobiota bacterium]